ncbi:hypothetical protein GGX14DRAFT_395784 [Mycena pura]|uniref:Uncharacterized protein n=1 Tax=Mycena pura TaxID=153505 RepID=A0AAD6VJD8_9AGAR|nr:hypothetical protein GGX14DRAFT_395784 [Mycena pura]
MPVWWHAKFSETFHLNDSTTCLSLLVIPMFSLHLSSALILFTPRYDSLLRKPGCSVFHLPANLCINFTLPLFSICSTLLSGLDSGAADLGFNAERVIFTFLGPPNPKIGPTRVGMPMDALRISVVLMIKKALVPLFLFHARRVALTDILGMNTVPFTATGVNPRPRDSGGPPF